MRRDDRQSASNPALRALSTQARIKADAQALQDSVLDVQRFQRSIKARDEALQREALERRGMRPDGALRCEASPEVEELHDQQLLAEANSHANGLLTPGNVVSQEYLPKKSSSARSKGPEEEGKADEKPREVMEREIGNEYFKQGDFKQAVKYYTRSIGFNPRCSLAYSNRAMALLKLKDFSAAELDSSCAIEIDPSHVKSFSRRGTARNALGRHRAALLDFEEAARLEPNNKATQSEIRRTKEAIKASVKRAPRRQINVMLELHEQAVTEDKKIGQQNETMENLSPNCLPLSTKKEPKSFLEFEKTWRELKETHSRQRFLIETMSVSGFEKIFGGGSNTMEPNMFAEIVFALESDNNANLETDSAMKKQQALIESIRNLQGIDMLRLFLSQDENLKIGNILSIPSDSR